MEGRLRCIRLSVAAASFTNYLYKGGQVDRYLRLASLLNYFVIRKLIIERSLMKNSRKKQSVLSHYP